MVFYSQKRNRNENIDNRPLVNRQVQPSNNSTPQDRKYCEKVYKS